MSDSDPDSESLCGVESVSSSVSEEEFDFAAVSDFESVWELERDRFVDADADAVEVFFESVWE